METFMRTVEPAGLRAPGRGRCATTVPFGCVEGTLNALGTRPAARTAATAVSRVCPTVSGTVTSPREIVIETVEPRATFEPAAGLCERTVPVFFCEMMLRVCTSKPFACSACTAAAALSPVTTPAKVWSPGPPKRPTSPPLQRASTADAVVDVYRNGVVEVQFTSTDAEAYRRLVRTSRFSSDTAGVDCLKVGFGAGRWEALGGGSNAHVGPLMGTRLGGGRGAHPIGGMPSPPFVVCQVSGTYGRYWNDEEGTRELVEVPVTAIGRRYLDERGTCRDLAYLVRSKKMHAIRLGIHRGGSAPSADELVRIFGPRLVPMASREGSAANGKVGVWSDGKLIIASELTPAGRRLYVTINALRIGPNNIRDLSFVY